MKQYSFRCGNFYYYLSLIKSAIMIENTANYELKNFKFTYQSYQGRVIFKHIFTYFLFIWHFN